MPMTVTKTKRKPTGAAAMGAGPGRPKGSINRVTRDFRETVQQLLAKNAVNVSTWLELVATGGAGRPPDPARALELLAKLAEYAAPKLGRVEYVGANGGPIQTLGVTMTPDEFRRIAEEVASIV